MAASPVYGAPPATSSSIFNPLMTTISMHQSYSSIGGARYSGRESVVAHPEEHDERFQLTFLPPVEISDLYTRNVS